MARSLTGIGSGRFRILLAAWLLGSRLLGCLTLDCLATWLRGSRLLLLGSRLRGSWLLGSAASWLDQVLTSQTHDTDCHRMGQLFRNVTGTHN